ncbi:DEAD/DEAH box helicase [Cryobacterium sp. 1639]|uniref:DEAD/DEAH box helicase n=1 Tax=Cryobacterium inferilacus TaxID=2866629 RepID=UPI001C73A0F0|nr:DEAD/DEAH box helicase [Cryobacterium sp. 1639]MBX0301094.1 DEAD/DEAH box helicase [Cryobacterium sp. 1639]
MREILPSVEAEQVRESILDYLTTTFALADAEAASELTRFLGDPVDGIFRGPYVRVRLPFRPADDGWQTSLEWRSGQTPYGHQAAAFQRLSSANLGPDKPRPLPTLVTTGTGSGKTEAFLYPILDHVLRAKREGQSGIKALILYPMNALANDQARRITELLTQNDELRGIRAALYTGQSGAERSSVTPDGLITSRHTIRSQAPDILLTNYKMLDQLLLRSEDQALWKQSAESLQYLVLDEFHTYDGAQGTDVSMLIRRLGLALRRYREVDHGEHRAVVPGIERPLGNVTPVATSATLGDKGDPRAMIQFAHTVFGDDFDDDSVVTETRLSFDEWSAGVDIELARLGAAPNPVSNALIATVNHQLQKLHTCAPDDIIRWVLGSLYRPLRGEQFDLQRSNDPSFDTTSLDADDLLALIQGHPLVRAISAHAVDAIRLDDLAEAVLPGGLVADETYEQRAEARRDFLAAVLAALSHVRILAGRRSLSIDLHLWVRSLTRLDRVAGPIAGFHWAEDGAVQPDDATEISGPTFPAIYCRHCGRSGWGIQLAPTGLALDHDGTDIRGNHLHGERGFRALMHAPKEARLADSTAVEGLHWFDIEQRAVLQTAPGTPDDATGPGSVVPVLMLFGPDAESDSKHDTCPSCGRTDGIRFIGSAVATMLSVAVTSLFGAKDVSAGEKKALVFTDSVQDAAHRAAFVQSRSHVFTMRNAIRHSVGDDATSLQDLVERLLQDAGDDQARRYSLLAPDIVEHEKFRDFWEADRARAVDPNVRERVRTRLLFDLSLEFGLQSKVGRTLELTGSLAAEVAAGAPAKLETIGRAVLAGYSRAERLDEDAPSELAAGAVIRWVRGVLERMRDRGAIDHEWLQKYVENDGKRWYVWGGRPKSVGMPAFPNGRDAPGFPRVGTAPAATGGQKSNLDPASSAQGWFAVWARDALGVTASVGAHLSRALFAELDREGVITSTAIGGGGAIAYKLSPSTIAVQPVGLVDLQNGRHLLVCDICQNPVPGTTTVIDQLADGPCMSARCPGALRRSAGDDNYYRRLYNDGTMRRVVAREHTSLLDDAVRLEYENGFKSAGENPAAPNVLVATPTLEMGIDIGDLSTVMLAGLPRSVASYLQRVGRAGRLTGNALALAFVTGRGEQLPKLGEPLSVINGAVRPPATYLNAEEILQRQYFAYLVDRRAATLTDAPQQARDVLKTAEEGSYLGELIADAEAAHSELLGDFLDTFDGLSDWASEALRRFATPGAEEGSSPVAGAVRDAVSRWSKQVDLARIRKETVADSLDGLDKAAKHPTAGDEEQRELRSAKAAYGMAAKQLAELRTEHWVAALERFGLLPNYSLLDDSVQLDVALSWIDPDTLEYRDRAVSYERGAGIAISELAPGAVFYAQGVEITVDSIDLGSNGEAVRTWWFCRACGFGYEHGTVESPYESCPRCGSAGIADTAQQLRVVELEKVSAEVRRDESAISDRRDERQRERFAIQIAADIDPAGVTDAWYVEGESFGVTYMRDLTIRWLNLGKVAGFGESRFISGDEQQAPLFRVCAVCGKLDTESNANSRREHKPWCPVRDSKAENATTLALSRTLTTQGIVLRLPPAVTIGDSLAVPSLSAAILRGLREVIGGDPDHLRIVETVEPVLSDGSENIPALLIHDSVPGGTGYLAELADPKRMQELLTTAWGIVRDCPCKAEGRASCHRCLLPYAPGNAASRVARSSAERSLASILGFSEDAHTPWVITRDDPGVVVEESVIEQLFRQVFMERAKKLGAAVKEIPTDRGNKVQVSFSGNNRIWMLRPQVQLGPTMPDFVLEQLGGGADPIAIYTDGLAFHATVQHNRIKDDAKKRAAARELGYVVMAVVWGDLIRARDGEPEPAMPWFDVNKASAFAQQYDLPLASLAHVTANPMTQLMAWMQNPDKAPAHWEAIADALPMLTRMPSSELVDVGSAGVSRFGAETLLGTSAAGATPTSWQLRHGAAVLTSKHLGAGRTECSLILDDRDSTLQMPGFAEDWRFWLRLSNLLGTRLLADSAEIVALSQVPSAEIGPVDLIMGAELVGEWAALHDIATEAERVFLRELAALEAMPVPEVGLETADGIPVPFAWKTVKVAAGDAFTDEDIRDLEGSGWIVVPLDTDQIASALTRR